MGQVLNAISKVFSVPGKVGGQVFAACSLSSVAGPLDWLLSGNEQGAFQVYAEQSSENPFRQLTIV